MIPLMLGVLGAPVNAPIVHGDELSDAKAQRARILQQIAEQKAAIATLNVLQTGLSADIRQTNTELRAINADLKATRARIVALQRRIALVTDAYEGLVAQLGILDAQLVRVEAEERAKRTDLFERQTLLAERIRSAYDTDRTSLLESFLSGGTFTDLLAEMSYFIDVGEQDKALAAKIAKDQETLAALHQTVEETRLTTNELRKETAAQKRELDRSLVELKEAQARLKKLERETARQLAEQKRAYAELVRNKANVKRAIALAAQRQRELAAKIDRLVEEAGRRGNIPSIYNGKLKWPLIGRISGEYGCSTYPGYAPGNGCENYHNGIDIVAPEGAGAKIRAAGDGVVGFIGWNWADGPDPAWIVIIVHSSGLRTWYAHMQPASPKGVYAGASVKQGQVIGYEGSTGNSTGAHLHWMVELNGSYMNPRLFL